MGMVLEAQIGSHLSGLDTQEIERITALIHEYQLPVSIPAKLGIRNIRQHLLQDKKICNGMLILPVLTGIGESKIEELPWNRFVSYMDRI